MAAGILVARLLGPSANGTLSVLMALAGMAALVNLPIREAPVLAPATA